MIIIGAKEICKSAVPFIGPGVDLFKGLKKASSVAITFICNWWRSINVAILAGHPSSITIALKKSMNWNDYKKNKDLLLDFLDKYPLVENHKAKTDTINF